MEPVLPEKIDHISIKQITEKAGYHRSTFYEYFVDIHDVLNQLEEALLAYIKETVMTSLGVMRKDDFIRGLADLYESKGQHLSVLLGENGDPHFAKKLKIVMRPVLIETFGMSESDIHASYIYEFAISGIIAAITRWYQSNKDLPSQELVSMIRSMLLSGVYPLIQKFSSLSSDAITVFEG